MSDPAPSPPGSVTSARVTTGKQVNVTLPPPHDDFSSAVMRRFVDLDTNRDGFISKDDVNRALQDAAFTADDAAMVATLKGALGDLESLSADELGWENDGITRADITEYDRIRSRDPKQTAIVKIQRRFAFAKSKIAARSANLFDGDPDVLSVRQGLIGDCWFLAALVALGLRDPVEVRKLIRPAKSAGKFIVKFPGVAGEITVSKPTDGELAIFALANGLWLPVLEKSYGAAANRDALFFVESSDVDAVDGGDFISTGIEVMSGRSTDMDVLSTTFETTTRDKLKDAMAKKKLVTAGVRGELLGQSLRDNGLPMGHAYTVMGFDPKSDKLKLRNPWGHVGLPFGEVFEQTITEFDASFSMIAYEE